MESYDNGAAFAVVVGVLAFAFCCGALVLQKLSQWHDKQDKAAARAAIRRIRRY